MTPCLTKEFEDWTPNMENPELVSEPNPQTLADRIEVALKTIAKNSGINLN